MDGGEGEAAIEIVKRMRGATRRRSLGAMKLNVAEGEISAAPAFVMSH
jgi:hypothetical protein